MDAIMITFEDLKEKLKKETELDFLEILDLTSVELVDLLEAEIYDKQERIREYYYDEDEEDGDYREDEYT
jgi:hypothetical protein